MKFSIRDVLLGTVIAALALGWWLDRAQFARQQPQQPAANHFELIETGKNNDKLFLFDRQTGAMWERYDGKWHSHTLPAASK